MPLLHKLLFFWHIISENPVEFKH